MGYTCYPYNVAVARNEAFKEARDAFADFLIMIDDDVVPDKNIVTLPEHDLPVLSGLVPMSKNGLICFNAFDLSAEGIYSSLPGAGEGIRQVYAVGSALICLRMDVLRHMKAPFNFELDEDGLVDVYGGEDLAFVYKCHAQDIPIYVDTDYVAEHYSKLELGSALVRGNPNRTGPSVCAFDASEHLGNLPIGQGYHRLRRERKSAALRASVHGEPVPAN